MSEDNTVESRSIASFSLRTMLLIIAMVSICLAICMPFRGFLPWFYYEEFEGVKRRLEAIDGVKIVDFWQHKDIVLEDCGFTITQNGNEVLLFFSDYQDWVRLFDEIDGVIITSGDRNVYLKVKHFVDAGIHVDSLTGVIENLDRVLELGDRSTGPEFDCDAMMREDAGEFRTWARIRRTDQIE